MIVGGQCKQRRRRSARERLAQVEDAEVEHAFGHGSVVPHKVGEPQRERGREVLPALRCTHARALITTGHDKANKIRRGWNWIMHQHVLSYQQRRRRWRRRQQGDGTMRRRRWNAGWQRWQRRQRRRRQSRHRHGSIHRLGGQMHGSGRRLVIRLICLIQEVMRRARRRRHCGRRGHGR